MLLLQIIPDLSTLIINPISFRHYCRKR